MELNIGHLYPDLLNIYGDRGNIITLVNRCHWRGIKTTVTSVSIGDKLKSGQFDLFFGGGGQDRQQLVVAKDLSKKAQVLKAEVNRGVPMLTICGTYQLFGHYFKTHENKKIPGIGIFDAHTIASYVRKIGNVVIKTNFLKEKVEKGREKSKENNILVGFENHSGNTFLNKKGENKRKKGSKDETIALGKVVKGFGNNGQDKTEGAIFNNVLGTYLHGPILPKNPDLADWLIKTALEKKYGKEIDLKPLEDKLENQAHQAAVKKV